MKGIMNKQKWVGVLTALTTAFSMMSWAIPASAAEGTPTGTSISAPQNITTSGTYVLTNDITDDGSTSGGAINVAEGVVATLYLDGHSITGMDSDSDGDIDTNGISNAGTLTVVGSGTITGRNAIANENYDDTPTLSVTNCTLKGTIRQGIWNNGSLTVDSCTISSDSQNGINNYGGTVTVTGSQITGATNGIWTSSDVTVSDSTVSGYYRAVCTTGGTCTIKSGTYSATSDEPDKYTCAVLVAPSNEDVTLDIDGGTYNTTGDYAIYKENGGYDEDDKYVPYDYSETITISDAVLNGGLSDDSSSSLNVTSIEDTTIAASGKVVNLNNDMTSLTGSTITCSNMNLKTLANCSDTTVNGNLILKNSANDSTISNLTATKLQVSSGKAAISGSGTDITTLSAVNDTAAITITEGTYGTLNGNGKYTISGGTFDTLSNAYFDITGGKFKSNPSVTVATAKLTIPDDTAFELSDGYYTLVSASGTGVLTLDCGNGIKVIANKYENHEYDVGTTVTVEAFDTPFAKFTGWYSDSTCTTLLSSDKEYTTTIAKGGTTLYAACTSTELSYTAYDYDTTDTFEVDSEEDLFGISYLSLIGYNFSGKTVKLTGDIAMTQNFYPIAATPNASGDWKDVWYFGNSVFLGTFDGDGHTISKFTCTYAAENYDLMTAGLIGHATNATVKNLTIKPVTVTGEYAAGLISWGICVTVSDCTVDGGSIGCPDTTGYAGGVFANASGCKITDTTVNAITIVNGNKTGAVVGNSYGLTLINVDITNVAARSIVGCVYEDCTINMDNCTATTSDSDILSVVGQNSGKATLNLTGDNTDLDISSMCASDAADIDITVNAGTYTCDVKPYLADGLAADYQFNSTSNAADTGDGQYVVISSTPENTTNADIVSKEVNDKYDHLKISTGKVKVDEGSKAVSFNVSCYLIGGSEPEWTQTVNGTIDGHGDINGNVLFNFIIKDIPADYVLDITNATGVTNDSE